jgi:hypothetical protein
VDIQRAEQVDIGDWGLQLSIVEYFEFADFGQYKEKVGVVDVVDCEAGVGYWSDLGGSESGGGGGVWVCLLDVEG